MLLTPFLIFAFAAFSQPNLKVEEVHLTVHPARAASPAMRIHFLPEPLDQTPGNAALLYLNAGQQVAIARADDPSATSDDQQIIDWLEMPIAKLPQPKVAALLHRYEAALGQFRLASLRDRCDFDPPFRTEGVRTLLPYLVDARALARLACLSARLKIARGDFSGALDDLALPMTQAHQLNQGQAFLIQELVAASSVQVALAQIQDLIAAEKAPNLYWALGDVQSATAGFHSAVKMERAGAFFSIPELKDARAGRLTAEQGQRICSAMGQMRGSGQHEYGQPGGAAQLNAALVAVKEYPAAKAYLLSQKMPEAEIDAMSSAQVLGLYQVHQLDYWSQELDKCFTLPFWQALPLLDQAETQMRQASAENPWSLLSLFIPAFKSSFIKLAMIDRRVAMMRTVEAIRAYAAVHDGQPPAALDEMTQTPAPVDPMTGRAFMYSVADGQVMIEAPVLTWTLGGENKHAPDPTGIRITLKLIQ
jgi:hypothetical protein